MNIDKTNWILKTYGHEGFGNLVLSLNSTIVNFYPLIIMNLS